MTLNILQQVKLTFKWVAGDVCRNEKKAAHARPRYDNHTNGRPAGYPLPTSTPVPWVTATFNVGSLGYIHAIQLHGCYRGNCGFTSLTVLKISSLMG